MREFAVERFSIKNLLAGLFKVIDTPSLYNKYKQFLKPELFFQNDVSHEVLCFRILMSWLHDIYGRKWKEDLTMSSYESYIETFPGPREANEKAINFFKQASSDPDIKERMRSDLCFSFFVEYLKLICFTRHSEEIHEKYQHGKPDEAKILMEKTIGYISELGAIDEVSFDPALDLEKELYSQVSERDLKKVLFLGARGLDASLGGFEAGTLNLFIGLTNSGKSMMAHHLISRAITQKMGVHITCVEDRKASFIRKIISCLTGIPITTLKEFKNPLSGRLPTDEEKKLVQIAKENMVKYVKIDFIYGASVDAIHKRKLDYDTECRIKGNPIPVVDIVDYTGHIAGKTTGDKMYEKMRMAYGIRKDFALLNNKISFDFAQINREGSKKLSDEKTLEMSDLAGSFDLSQVCDNIISLNRSAYCKSNSLTKFVILKARDGEVGSISEIKVDFSCARYLTEQETVVTSKGVGIDTIKSLDYAALARVN